MRLSILAVLDKSQWAEPVAGLAALIGVVAMYRTSRVGRIRLNVEENARNA